MEKDGIKVRQQLVEHFKGMELLEHYSAYYKYRVKQGAHDAYTNGAILTFVMDLVHKFPFKPG